VIFDPKTDLPWDERGLVEARETDGVSVVVVRA
jgi:hypothetical protein